MPVGRIIIIDGAKEFTVTTQCGTMARMHAIWKTLILRNVKSIAVVSKNAVREVNVKFYMKI